MLKKFKKGFILAIIGLGIFIGIMLFINNNKTKSDDTLLKETMVDKKDESIINKEEENNHIVEKDTNEITSKQEENEDLSVYPKETLSTTSEQSINQNTNTEKKSTNKNKTASTQKIEDKKQENVVPQVKDEPKKEPKPIQSEVVDNSVDTNSLDYNEHRGRIDCYSSDECMNISLPIQFKYSNSITHSQYIAVMSKSGNTLGYFIEYMFKEYTYSSKEECENIGSQIKQTLNDKITSYQCNGSTLKIYTSY